METSAPVSPVVAPALSGPSEPAEPRLKAASALRVLVIDGHPRAGSFGSALADHVWRAAASRAPECRRLALRELEFNPCGLGVPLEPDLRQAQTDILWANLLIFVYPTWWGTIPALLKGFLDRVLQPGFAFTERSDGGWNGLLAGRAALLLTTMDTPRWIYRWLLGAPGHRAMKDATLGFCGIGPVKILSFGPIRRSTLRQRRRWLARATREARRLGVTFRTGWRIRLRAWLAVARLHFYPQPWLAYTTGALAAHALAPGSFDGLSYALGYGLIFLLEFITVATNELADLPSDRINDHASALTGGSRVLVEGRLSAADLRAARCFALGALVLLLTGIAWISPQGGPLIGIGLVGLVLGWGYSAPPLRLSGRGLGELDVALTHSFLVILAGFFSQGGALDSPAPWLLALPLCLAVFPSIILAGFPDFEADALTGKRTLAVRLGRRRAAYLAGAAALGAALLPIFLPEPTRPWTGWIVLPALPHALWLCSHLGNFVKAGAPPGRIDTLLVLALTFMLWFSLAPLAALLFKS